MPIEDVEITDEQAVRVEAWLEANAKAPGWLDGYALGGAYIDPRSGRSAIKERRAYVRIDDETARAVPQLRGKGANDIREFIEARRSAAAPRA